MALSVTQQQFVDNKINQVLENAGVPINNQALREELRKNAEVDITGREAAVRVKVNDDRGDISLSERLAELRSDASFRNQFPATPTKVIAKGDMSKLRENFADIAAGKVAVE